jgi:hypothetical protein
MVRLPKADWLGIRADYCTSLGGVTWWNNRGSSNSAPTSRTKIQRERCRLEEEFERGTRSEIARSYFEGREGVKHLSVPRLGPPFDLSLSHPNCATLSVSPARQLNVPEDRPIGYWRVFIKSLRLLCHSYWRLHFRHRLPSNYGRFTVILKFGASSAYSEL